MSVEISPAHNEARLAATLAFANTGAGNSTIEFYATAQPNFGDSPGASPVVIAILAKPCGTLTAGALTLTQADPAGDLVTGTGAVLWARWKNGAGVIVLDSDVSDNTGTGFFKIAGTVGTTLYAGGSLLLGTFAIG